MRKIHNSSDSTTYITMLSTRRKYKKLIKKSIHDANCWADLELEAVNKNSAKFWQLVSRKLGEVHYNIEIPLPAARSSLTSTWEAFYSETYFSTP